MTPRSEPSFEQALRAATEARIARTLRGKRRLDHRIGVGGMASVYAATHRPNVPSKDSPVNARRRASAFRASECDERFQLLLGKTASQIDKRFARAAFGDGEQVEGQHLEALSEDAQRRRGRHREPVLDGRQLALAELARIRQLFERQTELLAQSANPRTDARGERIRLRSSRHDAAKLRGARGPLVWTSKRFVEPGTLALLRRTQVTIPGSLDRHAERRRTRAIDRHIES